MFDVSKMKGKLAKRGAAGGRPKKAPEAPKGKAAKEPEKPKKVLLLHAGFQDCEAD